MNRFVPLIVLSLFAFAPIGVGAQEVCTAWNNFSCPTGKTCSSSWSTASSPGTCMPSNGTNTNTNSGASGVNDPASGAQGRSLLHNPLSGVETLDQLLGKVLDAVIAVGTVIVTIMLVYCGFLFVVAQGNPEAISKAKSALLWTVIGGLILLGARGIQAIISSTVTGLGG